MELNFWLLPRYTFARRWLKFQEILRTLESQGVRLLQIMTLNNYLVPHKHGNNQFIYSLVHLFSPFIVGVRARGLYVIAIVMVLIAGPRPSGWNLLVKSIH